MNRVSKNNYYLDIAEATLERSTCIRRKFGCVIVKNDEVIACAYNMKEKNNCCLDHAELLVIREVSKILNNWRLDDCDLYVTLDPCPMCASAIKQARIKNVYSALNNSDSNNLNILHSIFDINDHTNNSVNFISNLAVDKSKKILNDFFDLQRK